MNLSPGEIRVDICYGCGHFDHARYWPELADRDVAELEDNLARMMVVPKGLSNGEPAVVMLVESEIGLVRIRTTARLLVNVGRGMADRYPELLVPRSRPKIDGVGPL